MSQLGQPELPHFSQSQHETSKRDSFNLLVPFGTRWPGQEGRYLGLWCVCIQSPHIKPHGSEEASKSSSGVLLYLRHYRSEQIDQGSGRDGGSRHTPKQQQTAFIHTWYPPGAKLKKLESDNQLEESTQTSWGVTVSHPFMYLGLSRNRGPSDIRSFGKVLVILTLINTSLRSLKTSVKTDSLTPSCLRLHRTL